MWTLCTTDALMSTRDGSDSSPPAASLSPPLFCRHYASGSNHDVKHAAQHNLFSSPFLPLTSFMTALTDCRSHAHCVPLSFRALIPPNIICVGPCRWITSDSVSFSVSFFFIFTVPSLPTDLWKSVLGKKRGKKNLWPSAVEPQTC